ncbi:F-box/LRR-repeat protein 7-like [Ptychodera flava]|uniref:F-box/LRR-repeat protein 7-like n=1 Tax=Ptychodera flava TaxID=63121 RepID=UPI00396AAC21
MHITALGDHVLLEIFEKLSYRDLRCSVRLTCLHWNKLSQDFSLWRVINLSELSDRKNIVTDEVLLKVMKNYCSKICKINLSGCTMLTDASFLFIADNCPALISLNIAYTSVSEKAMTKVMTNCLKLQHLNILGCRKLPITIFQQFRNLIKLQVRVDDFYTTSRSMDWCNQNLRQVAGRCPQLEFFDGRNSAYLSDDTVAELVTKCPKLRSLKFDQCASLTGDCIVELSKKLIHLKFISLANCGIGDEAVIAIAENCPMLTHLNISATKLHVRAQNITDASLQSIAMHCEKLQYLDIHSAEHLHQCQNLSDIGLVAVVTNCVKLRHLDIRNCSKISDKSLLKLAEHCTLLEHVEMKSSSLISSTGINAILQKCTRLLFIDSQKCSNVHQLSLNERFNTEGTICFKRHVHRTKISQSRSARDICVDFSADRVMCARAVDFNDVKEKHDVESVAENTSKESDLKHGDTTSTCSESTNAACASVLTELNVDDHDNLQKGIDQEHSCSKMRESKIHSLCGAYSLQSLPNCDETDSFDDTSSRLRVVNVLEYNSKILPMQLQYLDLSYCSRLTNASLEQIGNHCHHIKVLFLKELPLINDSGICHLIESLSYLENINVSCWQNSPSKVSDAALVKLAEFCPRLKRVIVWGTLHASDVGVKEILEKCAEIQEVGVTVGYGCTLNREGLCSIIDSYWLSFKCQVHDNYFDSKRCTGTSEHEMKTNLLFSLKP